MVGKNIVHGNGSSFMRRQGGGMMNQTLAHGFLNSSQDSSTHIRSNNSSLNRVDQVGGMTARDRLGSLINFEDGSFSNSNRKRRDEHD